MVIRDRGWHNRPRATPHGLLDAPQVHVQQVAPRVLDRITMGVSAFVFLLAAEIIASTYVFGNPIEHTFVDDLTLNGFVGLCGHLLSQRSLCFNSAGGNRGLSVCFGR